MPGKDDDGIESGPVLETHMEIHEHELSDEKNPLLTVGSLYDDGHNPPLKDICPKQGEGMKLMIAVTSAPGHLGLRKAIRSTWGNVADRLDVGLAFIVGISVNDSMNRLTEEENLMYGDIIHEMYLFVFSLI